MTDIAAGAVLVVAPSGFQRVAEIVVHRSCGIIAVHASLNVEPAYRAGLTLCNTF